MFARPPCCYFILEKRMLMVRLLLLLLFTFGPYINWRLSRPRLLISRLRCVFKPFVLAAIKQLGKAELFGTCRVASNDVGTFIVPAAVSH